MNATSREARFIGCTHCWGFQTDEELQPRGVLGRQVAADQDVQIPGLRADPVVQELALGWPAYLDGAGQIKLFAVSLEL